jgi:hypothetical protein
LREFSEMIKERGRTYPECGWHHPKTPGPKPIKGEEGGNLLA